MYNAALTCDSLCVSRSCLPCFRCPAVSALVCVSCSFSALYRVPHRMYGEKRFSCQTALILQLVSVSRSFRALYRVPHRMYENFCFLPNRPNTAAALYIEVKRLFLLRFRGHWPSRYRQASPSRFCNLNHKLLPCFLIGPVCPVHGLFRLAPVKSIPLWNFINHVLQILFSFFLRYVAGMYRVSDRALSFPGPSHLILSVRVRI